MSGSWLSDTRESYDSDADGYAEKVRDLLDGSPYLRASGPGYVTRHLHDLGVNAFGIDLSPAMIAIARHDYPDLRFEVGTMTDLNLSNDSVAGVLSFLVRDPRAGRVSARGVRAVRRVIRPGGPVLVGFHIGDETRYR